MSEEDGVARAGGRLAVGEEGVPHEHRVAQMELAPKQETQPAQQIKLRLHLLLGERRVQLRVSAAQQSFLNVRTLLQQGRALLRSKTRASLFFH